jgi:heat shock protein HtpX
MGAGSEPGTRRLFTSDVYSPLMRHLGLKFRMLIAGSMLFTFYAVLVAFGWSYLGGEGFMQNEIALGLAIAGTLVFAVFQYKFGKWMALRSVGAEDADPQEYQQLHWAVEDLASEMGLDKPRLMVAEMGVPNAFAVGRKGSGVVVVSHELMQLLDEDELRGVLAHELAHIRNRDVVMMVMGQAIASMVGIAVQIAILTRGRRGGFFAAIIAGQLAQTLVMLFVFAISRYREYVADSDAAAAMGQGDPLARALEKISQGHESPRGGRSRRRRGAPGGRGTTRDSSGLGDAEDRVGALCIFNQERGLFERIFSTHPPTEKRIERLRSGGV